MDQAIFEELQVIVNSNDNLIINCENNQERFELRFLQGNQLQIEYTDREFLYEDEGYPEEEIEDYSSLQELQKGALDFIIENNIDYVEIKKNNQILFSTEELQKKITKTLKGLQKREIGLRFGKDSEVKYLRSFT